MNLYKLEIFFTDKFLLNTSLAWKNITHIYNRIGPDTLEVTFFVYDSQLKYYFKENNIKSVDYIIC